MTHSGQLKRYRKCPDCGAVLFITRGRMQQHRKRHRPWTGIGKTRPLPIQGSKKELAVESVTRFIWFCPPCGQDHKADISEYHSGTLRHQLRSRITSHLASAHRSLGPVERSRLSDKIVQTVLK